MGLKKNKISKLTAAALGCAALGSLVGGTPVSAVSYDNYEDYTLEEVVDLEEGLESADMHIEDGNVVFQTGPNDNFYGSYTLRFDAVGTYNISIRAYQNDNAGNLEIVGFIADEEYTFSKSGDYNYYLYNVDVEDTDDVLTVEVKLLEDSVSDDELILGHTVTVKNTEGTDTVKPVISGNKVNYKVSVSSIPTLDDLFEDVAALDDVDGDVEVTVKDNGGYKAEIGDYTVVLSAKDSSNNESTVTTVVHVVDTTKPVISGNQEITSNLSDLLTIEEITAGLTVTDNYDNEPELKMIEDNYTANKNLVGTYTVKYEAKDSAGNVTPLTVSVTVKDDIKPTITGDNSYSVSANNPISLEIIKNNLTVTDNTDNEVKLELVEDKYTSNASVVGTYTVTYKATDKYDNTTNHVVTLNVKSDASYAYVGNVKGVVLYHNKGLSHNQIIDILLKEQGLTANVSSYETVKDTYSDKKGTVGTYEVEYTVTLDNSEVKTLKTTVTVVEGEEEKGFFAKVWDFIVRLFKNIGEFFVKLWKSITFKKPNWKKWY